MDTILYLNLEPTEQDLALADTLNWKIHSITTPLDNQQITRLIDFWKPAGIIIGQQITKGPIDFKAFKKIPVVCYTWDTFDTPPRIPTIIHDSYETGQFGARELLSLGVRSFAYIHPVGLPIWSCTREIGFRDALAINNCTAAIFGTNLTGVDYQQALRTFLAKLPKPCAILAANDKVGADILSAAEALSIAVPGEIAVLGVDDDITLCEHTRPRLSSIRPNFARCRELAARTLQALLQNKRPSASLLRQSCGPVGITHRASTRQLKKYDSFVMAALDKIAAEGGSGLRAREVVKLFNCSRPVAEARFRQATGRTILAEINATRLARIQTLLLSNGVQLKAIAHFCGFPSLNSLCNFFHRQLGLSPSAWRAQHQRHDAHNTRLTSA